MDPGESYYVDDLLTVLAICGGSPHVFVSSTPANGVFYCGASVVRDAEVCHELQRIGRYRDVRYVVYLSGEAVERKFFDRASPKCSGCGRRIDDH